MALVAFFIEFFPVILLNNINELQVSLPDVLQLSLKVILLFCLLLLQIHVPSLLLVQLVLRSSILVRCILLVLFSQCFKFVLVIVDLALLGEFQIIAS